MNEEADDGLNIWSQELFTQHPPTRQPSYQYSSQVYSQTWLSKNLFGSFKVWKKKIKYGNRTAYVLVIVCW